jgi:UDPglucose 6-dehydrogenase
MRVAIIGTGYVGLVTGACLGKLGHEVICVDKDVDKINMLQRGETPIFEPGLDDLLAEVRRRRRLTSATRIAEANDVEVALIAVGTPPLPSGEADLSFVFAAVDELARYLPRGAVLGTKSTVPVGTGQRIRERLNQLGRSDISVVSAPEFLREGNAVEDTLHPQRLVFGVTDERGEQAMRQLHTGLHAPIVVTDTATAEMIKYASNAFLATKISFINEIANICERVGADVNQVAHGMGLDSRIGPHFLRAGLGYGGSCFPKDTRALVSIAGRVGYDFRLLKAVVQVNQRQRWQPIRQLREWLGDLHGKHIALLGVAFKPGTDDTRESPALDLARWLWQLGATVRLCDPVVRNFVDVERGVISVSADPYEVLQGADAAILVTEWTQFAELDWQHVRKMMRQPYVFDGRNVLDPNMMKEFGFVFRNFGYRNELTHALDNVIYT